MIFKPLENQTLLIMPGDYFKFPDWNYFYCVHACHLYPDRRVLVVIAHTEHGPLPPMTEQEKEKWRQDRPIHPKETDLFFYNLTEQEIWEVVKL